MQKNLPQSLKTLISLIESKEDMNNNLLKEFLIRSNIKESDLLPFAVYDHPKNESFGRRSVYDGGRFKILVNTWNPGDFSAIHSHGYVDWGMIKYFGEGQQNVYILENDLLTMYDIRTMTSGSYGAITNELIHQTGNNSNTPFLTLHVYGSTTRERNISDGTEVFDLEFMQTFVTSGTAYLNISKYKNEISKTAKCPLPDKDTFMYNAILKLQFYCRQNDTAYNGKIASLLAKMSDYYG